MVVVNCEQMKKAERNCVERLHIDMCDLMERAGTACADSIISCYDNRYGSFSALVLCGKGNNGGDGFVIARRLNEAGFDTAVVLCCGEPSTDDSKLMFERIKDEIPVFTPENVDLDRYCDIIIDCIFGTGFSGNIREPLASFINRINAFELADKIAVDVPSGLSCDSAEHSQTVFKADTTLAVTAPKSVHIFKPESEKCGYTECVDIGITNEDLTKAGAGKFESIVNPDEIKALLPARPSTAHKGTFGHVLNVAGSMRMQGAAVLAAKGALRSGAGLVTVCVPDKAYIPVASKLTEPLMLPLPSDTEGFFSRSAISSIENALGKASAVLVGCGLGLTNATKEIVYDIIEKAEVPVIIDADGLNAVAENTEILKKAKAPLILTPHPGEMSRLCKKSIEEITGSIDETGAEFAREYGVTLVLKTANTRVFAPGESVYINSSGNSLLSRGGSGDLLAGMTAGFAAQGLNARTAAVCAVYLHGLAADRLSDKAGGRFALPGDIADSMATLLGKM